MGSEGLGELFKRIESNFNALYKNLLLNCQSYLISDDVLLSQKFEIGENTHHEIHLEKDKVPVLLNQFFLKKY